MPFWQRLVVTVVAMLAVSFLVGLIWSNLLGFALPSYVAGMVGGLTAIPVWEFLRRVRPKDAAGPPPAGG
jgi:putative flippase GtrA